MTAKQILFILALIITLGVFSYTVIRIISLFKLTRKFPVNEFGKRFVLMLEVAIGQTKIFRRPVMGLLHALVFWGFCVILFGSIEMVIDGLFNLERSLSFLNFIYDFFIASGDVFAYIVAASIIVFLFRRIFMNIKRFTGIEMEHKSHLDANIALTIILLLMLSLIGMNISYYAGTQEEVKGVYPLSSYFAGFITICPCRLAFWYQFFWWTHILLIFLFANILPYSKHFHVFMSVPNVFLSRLEPLGKLANMENVMREVKLMLNPEASVTTDGSEQPAVSRFGVKDVEDVSWKNYFDSLSCTECGRCTSVCPANITGKKLSPRKVIMNLRARMKEVGLLKVKNGKDYSDGKFYIKDWVSEEEIWACTTCNACAQECPININHPSLIVDLRRYLVMEEAASPAELNAIFANIENNGAPWQFSPEDRMLWAKDLTINE